MQIGRERIEKTKKNIKKAKIVKNKEEVRRKSGENLKSGVRKVVAGAALTALTAGLAAKANASNVNVVPDTVPDKESKNIVVTPQEALDDSTLVLTGNDFDEQLGDQKGKKRKTKKEIADSLERARLKQINDSLSEANRKNVALTGYNVKYSSKRYTRHGKLEDQWVVSDGENFFKFKGPINSDEIAKKYMEEHKKSFSKPVKYVTKTRGLDYFCSQSASIFATYGEYWFESNTIILYKYSLKGKEKLVDAIMKARNYSEEEADSLVMRIYRESHSPEWIEFAKAHEEGHWSDYRKGLLIPNLPRYYMNQIRVLTEIHGTMLEAALALEKFEQDGKLSHFAPVNIEVDTLDLQKQLLKENDLEKRKKLVGKYIFDKWLNDWNVEGSSYSNLIASHYGYRYMPYLQECMPINNLDSSNQGGRQEYLRRANEMFADVGYLGDMRDVINPDFELNPQLQVEENSFINDITQNSSTAAEAYERVARILTVVRDSDADGKRTQEEQDLINKTILTLREKAEQEGKKTQEGQESSNQTILLQKQTLER